MNSKDKGNLAEAKVLSDLQYRGFGVALPIGDNLPFDLIAVDTNTRHTLYKIQVKYTTVRNGTVYLRKDRVSANTKRITAKPYTTDEVDVFALYCVDTDKTYYVDSKLVSDVSSKFYIRIFAGRGRQTNNPNINDASLFESFPPTVTPR
jgi:Holliday junction resolvase